MYIGGFSCFDHDTAFSLIKDGVLIAALEEERFNREKHTRLTPVESINQCLRAADIDRNDISYVGINLKPSLLYRDRLLKYSARFFPHSLRYFQNCVIVNIIVSSRVAAIRRIFPRKVKIIFINHHLSHAASVFFVSEFEKAAILTTDAFGEISASAFFVGEGNKIRLLAAQSLPDSLGLLYNVFTLFLGFGYYDAGKVMGLAPYGEPSYYDHFQEIIRLLPEGGIKIDLSYFNYHLYSYENYATRKFYKIFGQPRQRESPIEKRYRDIAASLQKRIEDALLHMARYLYERTKCKNLCLAGGVALNSVANGRILQETPFENIFIQPAAGDAGCSLGCAYYIHHQILDKPRTFVMRDAYTGISYSEVEIEEELKRKNLKYTRYEDIEAQTAKRLADGKIVGWFQGRMEFGPRALGNRSILADPRDAKMKDIVNERVKHREGFRPFAPSILEEEAGNYFECDYPSPYMTLVYRVEPEKRSVIPAVTHIDGTARVHTVAEETNPRYYKLIKEFAKITGVPVILNTSFNVRGEPIVCSPYDAVQCYLKTEMDCLVMSNYILEKQKT